jgi:hypothetical protein
MSELQRPHLPGLNSNSEHSFLRPSMGSPSAIRTRQERGVRVGNLQRSDPAWNLVTSAPPT